MRTRRNQELKKAIAVITFSAVGTVWSVSVIYYVFRYKDSFSASPSIGYFIAIIAIGISCLFLSPLVLRGSKRFAGLTLAMATVFALYLSEAVHLGIFWYPGFPEGSPPLSFNLTRGSSGVSHTQDNRTHFEVIRDHRLDGLIAFPAFFVNDRTEVADSILKRGGVWPLGGLSLVRTVHCNEVGYWAEYDSDEKGFDNPPGSWATAASLGTDLLLLGDSFVQGACVKPEYHFSQVLRDHGYKAINLGQRGNGPLLNYAALVEYGPELKPKTVLWFYTENNDLVNLKEELSNPFLKQYLNNGFSQELVSRVAEVDATVKSTIFKHWKNIEEAMKPKLLPLSKSLLTLRSLRKRFGIEVGPVRQSRQPAQTREGSAQLSKVTASIAKADDRRVALRKAHWDPLYKQFQDILVRAAALAGSWGGELIVIYLPGATSFLEVENPAIPPKEEILERVSRLGLPIIDVTGVIRNLDQPMDAFAFENGGHYSELGYHASSEFIADELPR